MLTHVSLLFLDPTTEVDIEFISCRCITESGEGKDRIDSNCAIVKKLLRQARNKGHHQRNAADYVRDANAKVVAGNVNFEVKIDASLHEPVAEEKKRKPVDSISGLYLWEVDDDAKTITFWEALDREASDCVPFKPVGYGPGRTMTLDVFNDRHRTRSSQLGATIVDEEEIELNTVQLKSKDEKKESREEKEAIKEEASAKRLKVKEEKETMKTSQDREMVFECNNCNKMFVTELGLQKHEENAKCEELEEERVKRREEQDVKVLVSERNKAQVKSRDLSIQNMALVEVTLTPSGSRDVIGLGLKKNDKNEIVVSSVDEDGLAFFGMQIAEGFVLMKINDEEVFPMEDDDADEDFYDGFLPSKIGEPLKLLFHRAEVPLPVHGFARKNLHKMKQFSYHDRQLEWLIEYWEKNKLQGTRAEQMCMDMKTHFGNEVRDDISAPFWLDRTRLRGWINSNKKAAKDKRKLDEALEKLNKKKIKEEKKKQLEDPKEEEPSKKKAKINKTNIAVKGRGGRGGQETGNGGRGGRSVSKKRPAEAASCQGDSDSGDESSVYSESDFSDSDGE